ncbi:hypothetical protein GCM10010174_48500 [Kutzneria viridogrisea]|uniref:Uncharacterized protein n=1 Tax=Kutzneria viridogrisea TaxID=47990 RepID=A0ABR6BYR4_9PSEU|nr:hypothetical protein [Kutzneria viridogrisea]
MRTPIFDQLMLASGLAWIEESDGRLSVDLLPAARTAEQGEPGMPRSGNTRERGEVTATSERGGTTGAP